ncbi:hypothetical protein [Halorussus ruber]|uniref:hypothetical protein n=1 Tax=Halorussus ruber TaxID=1126238 RepID=UPI001092D781|nr:hypothetical protein [Halorussus ruber]
MEPTVLVTSSLVCVGLGYALLRRAMRFWAVRWALLGASLFALATRDLFRSRERSRPTAAATPRGAANRATDRADDERQRAPMLKRLRRRLGSWLG